MIWIFFFLLDHHDAKFNLRSLSSITYKNIDISLDQNPLLINSPLSKCHFSVFWTFKIISLQTIFNPTRTYQQQT